MNAQVGHLANLGNLANQPAAFRLSPSRLPVPQPGVERVPQAVAE